MSSESSKNCYENNKINLANEKEIYFLVTSHSEDKINFFDSKCLSKTKPEIIYYKRTKNGKDSFTIHHVFKLTINKKEKNYKWINYLIQYEFGEELYNIILDIKENIFIYKVKLQKYNKYINNIAQKDIDQNQTEIQNKFELFLEALKKIMRIIKLKNYMKKQ